MADPSKLDFSDWFAVAVAAIVSGMVGAMGWFSSTSRKLDERIMGVEAEMREWDAKQAAHSTDLAVVKTCQENTAERLAEITEATHATNHKLDRLIDALLKKDT